MSRYINCIVDNAGLRVTIQWRLTLISKSEFSIPGNLNVHTLLQYAITIFIAAYLLTNLFINLVFDRFVTTIGLCWGAFENTGKGNKKNKSFHG
jgi:hypothetical protein